MKVIKSELIRPFDCDGTLIVPFVYGKHIPDRAARIYDEVSKQQIMMARHEPNIRLLLEEKHRGGFIVVWSRSGYEWAANVVKALGLEPYVDLVMSKPIVYIDDMPVDTWLKDRVYLDPDINYKK